jgi:hypothetical protein
MLEWTNPILNSNIVITGKEKIRKAGYTPKS